MPKRGASETTTSSEKRTRVSDSNDDLPPDEVISSGAPTGVSVPVPAVIVKDALQQRAAEASTEQASDVEEVDLAKLLTEDMLQDDPASVAEALKKLNDHIFGGEEDAKKISKKLFNLGGHAILAATVKRWRNEEGIQRNGLRALSILMVRLQFGDGKEVVITALLQMGMVEHCVGTLENFSESLQVQQTCFCAIGNLFFDIKTEVQDNTVRFIKELGGFKLVVAAMKKFINIEAIQERGCVLLYNVAFFKKEGIKKAMLTSEVLLAVGAAKTTYPENEDIHKLAAKISEYIYAP